MTTPRDAAIYVLRHTRSLLKRVRRRAVRLACFWRWWDHRVGEILLIPVLFAAAWWAARFARRTVDVGLGPEPLINNQHHKLALTRAGYTAETFVYTDNFISSAYDVNLADRPWSALQKSVYLFLRAIFRYRVLFIYFNGGPLFATHILRRLEPRLLRMARVKVVVMPYGADVQVMERTPNLYFRHTMSMDYPHQAKEGERVREQIERWSLHADCVLSGCEWVDYMPRWDRLQIAHFSIDTEAWKPRRPTRESSGALRILHAPNHPSLKGTQALESAVSRLRAEGLNIELRLLRGVPNTEIRDAIEQADIVADQFVIGWYAMFAIEAMALKKPVLCYLRDDLGTLYEDAGLLRPGEIPIIPCGVRDIEDRLRWAYHNRWALPVVGERGREYVQRHHSTEAIGAFFGGVLGRLGVTAEAAPIAIDRPASTRHAA